jgi:non-ribosomal peptide synthetase component F
MSLIGLFESACVNCAAKVAIKQVWPSPLSVTFSELNLRATQISLQLASHGAFGKVVGVCIEHGIDQIAAVLAVLKINAIYVPIETAHASVHRSLVQRDSGAIVVLCTDQRLGAAFGTTALVLEPLDLPSLRSMPAPKGISASHPNPLLYIMYTSGSTGSPKGVYGAQSATINRIQWMWAQWPFSTTHLEDEQEGMEDEDDEAQKGLVQGGQHQELVAYKTALSFGKTDPLPPLSPPLTALQSSP